MFRTEIPLTPLPHQLPPSARVLTLGSCFSDSIGARLTEFKVATLVNPFGTVFNPLSACKLLRAAAGEDVDWQQHLVEARGRWQSYDLHAEIGADSPVDLLQHISQLTREVGVFLATADVVVLTLGSAYAYRLRETGELVSNCHKVPADQFDKELLTADEIIAAVAETHAYLRRINPKLRFVLTVSPVRHLKDTLVLNSASKAMLRVACHYLSELLPDVTYFPAYELLVDDLRDYRFYATDMLHLSESAENYVWEKFTRTYFDTAFGRFKKEWEGIRQNLGHRPLHPAAPEHRAFLESTLERLHKLGSSADVRMELLHVERELASLPEPKSTAPVEEEHYDDGEERIDIGSFDDQAAIDEAQPVAVAQVVAAATQPEPAPQKEAGKEEADKKVASRAAVFAKTRLTSQASLLQAGAGLLVEDAEETEHETEDTETDEATVSSDSAYDHAYSPTATNLTDETESDEAEADEDDNEEANPEETVEEAARRKKRRSRGGAKRTKRKHARLAAEQAETEGPSEASAVATAPAPMADEPLPAARTTVDDADDESIETGGEPASDVVYVTEAELRQPRTRPEAANPVNEVAVESTAKAEEAASETEEATPEIRRSRNNRRGNKREQAPRYGGRPGRQPLYAEETTSAEEEVAPVVTTVTPTFAAVEPVTPAPAQEADATQDSSAINTSPTAEGGPDNGNEPAAKKRSSRSRAPKKPVTEPAAKTETASPNINSAAPMTVTAAPTETVAAEAAPAKAARRKPAAKPKAQTAKAMQPAEPVKAAATPELPGPVQVEPIPERAKTPAKKRTAAKPTTTPKAEPQATATSGETATPKPTADVMPATEDKKATKPKPAPKAATKPKPAVKKAPAKAKPAAKIAEVATGAAAGAPAAPVKAPAKPRAKAAAKPTKKAKPETPEG